MTRRGVETAIVVSISDYRNLLSGRKKLSEFLGESPLAVTELDLTRDKSPLRDNGSL
ncbi:MAG: hypothetical protein ACJ78Q_12495 [Chloroflexia bacterium]